MWGGSPFMAFWATK
jgi:hypothetical protein